MNRFCVSGHLTKDPELKTLENENKVANITIAIDRDYKDKDGKKITDFLHYALWNKDAERLVKLSKKGALIELGGYCVTKEVETKDGKIPVMSPIVDNYKHLCNSKDSINEIDTEEKENEMEK